ncbi:MAG: flagellar basal body rod C-terminal domain-containing protein [Desulfovibrio sp.]|uniref:flagellar basal body rod C-terminal domain-containing protein n=1 Tax=Desulfovibrio sp. TaxID=885 RepID=UPI0039E6E82C
MSSISSSMQLGASAMNTHSWGMAVTAHNVANVSTAGFEPQRAVYATGPAGQGVHLDAVLQGNGAPNAGGTSFSAAQAVYDVTSGLPLEATNPSGTDLSREMVSMITNQHAYKANAAVVRTGDDMLGTLLDIKA